jgi:Protein of unknown function (DUF3293)
MHDVTDSLPLAHIASLPAVFMAADYKWELRGVWSTLRIGEPAPELDAAFPAARRFGMTTAANPGQIIRADADNRSGDQALQRKLTRLGLEHRPAFVAAHSRIWKAYNWLLIDPDDATFDALTREFDQIGSLLWSRGEPVRLRMRAQRPEMVAEHPYVDWVGDSGVSDDTRAKPAASP